MIPTNAISSMPNFTLLLTILLNCSLSLFLFTMQTGYISPTVKKNIDPICLFNCCPIPFSLLSPCSLSVIAAWRSSLLILYYTLSNPDPAPYRQLQLPHVISNDLSLGKIHTWCSILILPGLSEIFRTIVQGYPASGQPEPYTM